MTRTRIAIVAVAVAVLAALAYWTLRRPLVGGQIDGPIIIFSIDTLRADRLPVYGYTKIRTPHIDAFAADGVIFENAYSHSPQTLPAHTSMFSGRLPFEHGVRDNIGFSLKAGERLVQHALKDRGFATGGFVSAYVLRTQTGFGQGFDVYDDQLPPASPDRPLGQVQRTGDETVAAALGWIDRQTSPKFMAFVHIYEPHKPYAPPPRFTAADRYDGEVEYSDEIFGKLIAHLKTTELYDRATIVLLSDHGEGLGDHGEDEHGIFLYRETIRVPLIIKMPGQTGGGRRVSAPVQHIDLPPTILDLTRSTRSARSSFDAAREDPERAEASGQAAQIFKGRSLRPVLDGTGPLPDASIYSEALSPRYHFGWSELYALSDERYRLIRAPRDELYDIQQDPKELTSIAAERTQARTAMRSALDAIIANAAVDAPASVSAEDRQKLAALGYVGTQTGASLTLPGDELPDPKDKIGVLQKYKRATALAGERRFADAIALYRDILREEPGMTDVWLQLAESYGRRGMTEEAIGAYREVVKRNPKDPAGLTGAASGLLRLGRLDEARAHAELAVDTAPATSRELLARIAVERGDADTARREAQLARAADATLPTPAFIEGLILHRQQQYAAALPHFLEARQALTGRTVQVPDVNYYIGDSLARLDRYAEAEAAFRAELGVVPNHVRAYAGLAMLYRAMGRSGDSERAIADLIRTVPTPEAYDVAAQLWTMFGEPARAAAVKSEARRLPR